MSSTHVNYVAYCMCLLKGHRRNVLDEEMSSICVFDIEERSVRME